MTLAGSLRQSDDQPGILVTAPNVTIDLNGHTLTAVGAGDQKIGIDAGIGVNYLTVRNGYITGWEIGARIFGEGAIVENVTVTGCLGDGLLMGRSARISGCTALDNNGRGIVYFYDSIVDNCVANDNGGDGITSFDDLTSGCVVSRCTAANNAGNGISMAYFGLITESVTRSNDLNGIFALSGVNVRNSAGSNNTDAGILLGQHCSLIGGTAVGNQGHGVVRHEHLSGGVSVRNTQANSNTLGGIQLGNGATVTDCTAVFNQSNGIEVGQGGLVADCTVRENANYGIVADSGTLVRDNVSSENTAGILAFFGGSGVRIDGNTVFGNGVGIASANGSNLIVRNLAMGSNCPYNLNLDNDYAAIEVNLDDEFIIDRPWANFSDVAGCTQQPTPLEAVTPDTK